MNAEHRPAESDLPPAISIIAALLLSTLLLLSIIGGALGATFQSTTAVWPAPIATDRAGGYRAGGWSVTSGFGWRDHPQTGQPEFHNGIDIAGPTFCRTCPVPSMFDATVQYVGWDRPDTPDPQAAGGGQVVMFENGAGDFQVIYAHLEPYRLYVQLQGRIRDSHARYPAYANYQPIGGGELLPDASGSVTISCLGDPPRFVAARTGPGTLMFAYDRPATCETSITWGQRGGNWQGWTPDGPTTLRWSTPIQSGQQAGDVALRFRASLTPPPPPPSPTPTLTTTGALPLDSAADARIPAAAPNCQSGESGAMRCTWELSSIPTLVALPSQPGALPRGSSARMPQPTPTVTPGIRLAASADPLLVPPGGLARIAVGVFGESSTDQEFVLHANIADALEILAVRASGATCRTEGNTLRCTGTVTTTRAESIEVVVRVRLGTPPDLALESVITAQSGTQTLATRVRLLVEARTITPAAWPPPGPSPTPMPTATPPLLPTLIPPPTGELPTPVPLDGGQDTAPCYRAAIAALTQQGASYSQGGALAGDPIGADGQVLPRTGPHSFDCSGLVWWAYAQAGLPIGMTTAAQIDDGTTIACTLDDLNGADTDCWAPGDLIFLRYEGGRHVAIYVGSGLFMDCYSHAVGCVLHAVADDPFYRRHFEQARRIVSGCEGAALNPGLPVPVPFPGNPQGDVAGLCVHGQPGFTGPVEHLAGCGPPVRPGDRLFMLDSTVGFVGMSGVSTGPHLHLGLRARSYDGRYPTINVCTPTWLQGRLPPPGESCWTDMADPLDFLPRAAAGALDASGTPIPEGAPFQLPPPGYPGALVQDTPPDATPVGQYWSPNANGGRYGGGGALDWLRDASCSVWSGWPWCTGEG